jgi:hypothetical protein
MYRLLFILAFFFASIIPAYAAPETPSADDPSWKAYKKLLENYYFLGNQKAAYISCHVSVPQLQKMMQAFEEQSRHDVMIYNNLNDFSVTYDRAKGISINLPQFDVSASPDSKVIGPEKTEEVRKGMEDFFAREISAVKLGLVSVLNEMVYPTREKRKNLSVTKNGNATDVSYDINENDHVKVEYSGTSRKITESAPTFNLTGVEDYQLLDGKLAESHFVLKSINTAYSVSYQDLRSAFFPAQILIDMTPPTGSQQVKQMHLEINLDHCSASGESPQ